MSSAFKFGWRALFVLCLIPAILAACTSNTSGDTSGNTSGGDLTGIYWKLTSVDFNAQTSNLIVSQPDKYTVTFQTNGTANVKADCNTAALSYTTNGNQLTIKPGATTLVYCGEGSLSDRFLQALQSATSYSINNSELTIISKPDGTMTFKQG